MANISTNQVKQLFVMDSSDTLSMKSVNTAKGTEVYFEILDSGSAVKEKTDLIPLDNILNINTAAAGAASQQLHRKAFLIKLKSTVNSGNPVAGQDYVINLTYRNNVGEEITTTVMAEAHATTGMTAAQLLQALASSFIDNAKTPAGGKYYNLYATDKTALTKANLDTKVSATGFYLVEPIPDWSLARFPESLMKMELSTNPIMVSSDEVIDWLDSYATVDATTPLSGTVAPIYNSHKLADLEYFCKGERGISAPLHKAYRDQIVPDLKVNPKATYGYDILTIHFAFVGHNASNQRSEKDIVIIIPSAAGSTTVNDKLSTAQAGIEALLPISAATAAATYEEKSE